jgi:hypothetical protein
MLEQQAFVNTVMNPWDSWKEENFLASRATISFSIMTVLREVGYIYYLLHVQYRVSGKISTNNKIMYFLNKDR